MVIIILLCLIFVITVIIIWAFAPDTMDNEEDCKASVKDLWGVVRICQTSNFGKPSLTLRPARRSVEMFLHFPDANRVSLSLPLLLEKQKTAKQDYIELFSDHGLTNFEAENQLTAYLDRNDETLGYLVTLLYRKIFEAKDTDTVNFKVKAVSSDLWPLRIFKRPTYKLNPDYKFEAPSIRHKGKSAHQVQTSRILNAVSWLLYPPTVILSYEFFGLNVMCWTALIFLGFFTFYRTAHQGKRILESWVSILYCILIVLTLVTRETSYLQFIPSGVGMSMAILSGALMLGLVKPKSASDIRLKQQKPKDYIAFNTFWVFGGLGLFFFNEWARNNLDFESWVWFFGLVRLEWVIAMTAVFAPFYALFLSKEKDEI